VEILPAENEEDNSNDDTENSHSVLRSSFSAGK
jgi:hypothetical protein